MEHNYAKTILDRLGGATAVADYLKATWGDDIGVATVRMWAHRKAIPWKWRPKLSAMAQRLEVAGIDSLYPDMPEAAA